jgi:site-specific DNA-cytosine methylase
LEAEAESFRETSSGSVEEAEEIRARRRELWVRAQARNQSIPDDFRYLGDGIESALESFRISVNAQTDPLTGSAAV